MKKVFKFFLFVSIINFSFAEEEKKKPTIEIFQDWILSCNPDNKLCIANQTIRTDKGLPVALINITHVAGNTVLEFGLPLMMNLQKPIKVEVDENMISTYGYNTCSQSACFVIRNNDEKLLDSFKSGNKATVTAESIDRKRFDLTFSLKGFTDTINKLKGK